MQTHDIINMVTHDQNINKLYNSLRIEISTIMPNNLNILSPITIIFPNIKLLSTLPLNSYLGHTPASEMTLALCRFPCSVSLLLADQRKLTGTSQPNARGTLLPP